MMFMIPREAQYHMARPGVDIAVDPFGGAPCGPRITRLTAAQNFSGRPVILFQIGVDACVGAGRVIVNAQR